MLSTYFRTDVPHGGPAFMPAGTADEKVEAAPNGKIEAAADEKVDAGADEKVDGGVFTPTPVGKCFFVCYFLSSSTLVTTYGRRKHQGKWVALLDRKGSGHVQVNGKTISKYSFCFLNSGNEVVLSQAENNAYIVQLLLESPSDDGTSAGKGKPLNIENQMLEERWWITESMPASTSEMSSKSAAVMGKHYAAIIEGQNIEVSFDDFPYYLR
ncbi:hypothetical protein CQW23_15478 [Capsicum baccatum]|uniref:Uncharacterized protein n=1 Tax=Capsicum baccatum TaxID=33114 RepID=A0A2G2WMD1_CAPBA|nr:hypothetical protein CQW23_15478 [Capsicum baccatum]